MSLFYRQPGLDCLRHPPSIAIPECKASDEQTASPSPDKTPQLSAVSYMGETFPHICRFWYILHEVSLLYCGGGKLPWGASGSLPFAEFKFRELLAWSNSLPSRLYQGHHNPHHVQILQSVFGI